MHLCFWRFGAFLAVWKEHGDLDLGTGFEEQLWQVLALWPWASHFSPHCVFLSACLCLCPCVCICLSVCLSVSLSATLALAHTLLSITLSCLLPSVSGSHILSLSQSLCRSLFHSVSLFTYLCTYTSDVKIFISMYLTESWCQSNKMTQMLLKCFITCIVQIYINSCFYFIRFVTEKQSNYSGKTWNWGSGALGSSLLFD